MYKRGGFIIYFQTARKIFVRLKNKECTEVREVKKYPLNRISGLQKALSVAGHNVAIWQHDWDFHVAAIYIEKGTGFNYNRAIYNLYKSSNVKTIADFKKSWIKTNGSIAGDGQIPKVRIDHASDERSKQKSYIVAKAPGKNDINDQIDRTHLIPLSVTGIEYHKGLLIDFSASLNRQDMNDFEKKSLNLTKQQDIIWASIVFPTKDNYLAIREIVFNKEWKILGSKTFTDRKNAYWWFNEPKSA